jgi:O-antigen/teichoic acid export membrane protein
MRNVAEGDREERAGRLAGETSNSGYGRGARILSLGIATTGVVTFAYFSVASHVLGDEDYKAISLLWSVLFVTVSVIYRPIEQLLSRTIADRRARGLAGDHPLRTPLLIQGGFALAFAAVALALRGPIEDGLFDGSAALYWILFVAVLAYAASYFARGWLAGHQWFGLYGGLVFLEATSRLLFALAVAVGIAEGQTAVALGMAAAPFVSLVVVPLAFSRRPAAGPRRERADEEELGVARGGRFAVAVLAIMLAEQTFLNAGPLIVKATTDGPEGAALAGFTFNVLLIARAPLQLFQAIQTSILPHLTRLRVSGESDPFRRSVNVTLVAIAAFAGCVAVTMLAIGPWLMDLVFGGDLAYDRLGLVLIALGMGLYLAAATLNQALLARARARAACACWLAAAAAYVGFLLLPGFDDRVVQVEVGYAAAALLLSSLLYALYRRSHRDAGS